MIITRIFEFKIFVLTLGVLFLAVLTMTARTESRRPRYLTALFAIYVVFQAFQYMEFFPLTGFQRFAKPEDYSVRYVQVITRFEDGSSAEVPPQQVLPALAHGRLKYFMKQVFRGPGQAEEFATAYAQAYGKRKPGSSPVLGLEISKKKWDLEREPHDSEKGFTVKKIKAEVKA